MFHAMWHLPTDQSPSGIRLSAVPIGLSTDTFLDRISAAFGSTTLNTEVSWVSRFRILTFGAEPLTVLAGNALFFTIMASCLSHVLKTFLHPYKQAA